MTAASDPALPTFPVVQPLYHGGKATCEFNTHKGSSEAHHEGLRKSGSHPRRALLKCHENWRGSSGRCRDTGLAFLAFALITRAKVQAHWLSSVLALHEGVPRAMDHHSSGCLPVEKFTAFASDRQGTGPATFLGFHHQFHLTRPRDVVQEESPACGDGSARRAH
jgi:hypothetical protein